MKHQASFIVAALTLSCGGPNYRFDPAPAPAWINEKSSDVTGRTIEAVGTAPITTHVARDVELATLSAKSVVAQMFESKVAASASDWTLAVSGGATDAERTVASSSVEVRSSVNVEDVTVDALYRDEATRTQYAKISVDRPAWARRLRGRLADGLDQVQAKLAAARDAADAKRPMAAYGELLAAYALGKKIEPDIVVIDLLDREAGVRAKLRDIKRALDGLGTQLRDACRFAIEIRTADAQTKTKLVGDLRDFLAGYGFVVGEGATTVRLQIELGQRFVASERVADRTEHVHAATGSLKALDADGGEIAELGFTIASNRYTERDVDRMAAKRKALHLAADTVGSKFRSAFRKLYEHGE